MNHGREAGATAMGCEMAGMVPLGVPLLFFRFQFYLSYYGTLDNVQCLAQAMCDGHRLTVA